MFRSTIFKRAPSANGGLVSAVQDAITSSSTKVISSTPDPIASGAPSSFVTSNFSSDQGIVSTSAQVLSDAAAKVASRPKPRNTQITEEAALANAEPSLWTQFFQNEHVVAVQEYLWSNFALGAADFSAVCFCSLYIMGTYWDRRTRFGKSRFMSLMSGLAGAIPYYLAFWFFKKYLAYIMDVPDLRGGVSSSVPLPEKKSWQKREQEEYQQKKSGKVNEVEQA